MGVSSPQEARLIRLYESMRGGAESIQSLKDDNNSILDIAKNPQSSSYTFTGTAAVAIYTETATVPWIFYGGVVNLTNMVAVDEINFQIYVQMQTGTGTAVGYVQVTPAATYAYTGSQTPAAKLITENIFNVSGVRVNAQQTVTGAGGFKTITYEFYDAKRGF